MKPKIAVWIASVFRYAVVTTKERSFIASSIMPVATIWLSAPSSSHGQNTGAGHGTLSPVADQHDGKEQDRKRKAEQEADIGRAPGAERPRQRPLHRIARDLAERSDDGEGNPERGDGEHGGGYRLEGLRTVPGGAGAVNGKAS